MEIRLLGPLEVFDDGRPVALPHGRARSLLALLALHPGEVLGTDRLIDALWGEAPPPTALTALQGHISKLRKRLEPARAPGEDPTVIVTHHPGYVLDLDGDRIDAIRFRRMVETASTAPAPRRADDLRSALELWRGSALADFVYEPFAQAPITALEELRMLALEGRIGADLELGRHPAVVTELEQLVDEHPLREELRHHLMLALYRCGRQVEALDVYRDLRGYLIDELGVEPGPRLQALERAILDQDPALAAPETVHLVSDDPGAGTGAASRWLHTDRRTVTVMFIDISLSASQAAADASDPEIARPVLSRARTVVRTVVERVGGTIEGSVGDIVVAVFGLPVTHEDDALRAVRAAHELRRELADVDDARAELGIRSVRVGISTGEVVVDGSEEGPVTSGPPVAVAARLQQLAEPGDVLLSDTTRRLVEPVARLEPVAGRSDDPTRPDRWRLVDVVTRSGGFVLAGSPLVGRGDELAELLAALDRAVRDRRAGLVTVLGEAGIGKSRLARAFAEEVGDDVRVVVGRCRGYGQGITYWPLREVVQDLAAGGDLEDLLPDRDDATEPALIASAVGLSDAPVEDPGDLFAAIRDLLEHTSADGPLAVVIEDVHWAQPTLLDLLEYLADAVHGPVLLLCLARPELLEQRPRWTAQLSAARTVELAPLRAPQSRELVTHLLGDRLITPETRGEVLAMGQGNPLFLEQLLAALQDDRELAIPPTVEALLMARLDRLGPAERDLLRCASVIGPDVPTGDLRALVPDAARTHLARHLEALVAKDLIRPWDNADDRPGFDFAHVLVQQAAYRSLTHAARADLHERLADRLADGSRSGRGEVEELVGHHLERAVIHRRDIGRSGPATDALALRAGERLASAGLRAYGRFDVPAAENLLSRARRWLPADHPQRPRVLRRLTEAYPIMGRPQEAEEAFAELQTLAERDGDDAALRRVHLERTRFRLITGPDPIPLATIQEETEEALEAFRREGDDVGVSQAHYVLASVHLRAGRMAELEEIGRRGIDRARRTGDLREQLGAPWWVVFAMLGGPRPVPECIRGCEDVVDVGPLSHLGVLAALGHFRAMLGEIDEGRSLVVRARELLQERIRVPRPLTFIARRRAGIELLAGDAEAAVSALREALDVSLRVTERDQASQVAGRLSILLGRTGRADEAARLAILAREQAPAEGVAAQALARAADARVALDTGDAGRAERLSREALDLVPADMLLLRAQLHLGLAEVVAGAGRDEDAGSFTAEAAALYTAKGNVVAARQVQERSAQR